MNKDLSELLYKTFTKEVFDDSIIENLKDLLKKYPDDMDIKVASAHFIQILRMLEAVFDIKNSIEFCFNNSFENCDSDCNHE